jgi:hypothetical protein
MSRWGVVTAGSLAAATAITSPTAAVTYDYGPWYNSNRAARAYFEPHGDYITAQRHQMWLGDTYNDGKCAYSNAGDGGSHNLPEKHAYKMKVYLWTPHFPEDVSAATYQVYNNA